MGILLSSSWESFIKLISVLLIFVFVLAITYFTTRWMGGITKARGNNKNLKIVESIGVGNNKFVTIIEAGSKYLVLSIGKEEVHLLAELTRDELKDFSFENEPVSQFNKENFQDILEKIKKRK